MQFLTMTLMGGGLALAVAVLRLLLRDKMPPACWLTLWGAALCRLLAPVSFASPISILNLYGRFAAPHAVWPPAVSHAAPAAPGFPALSAVILTGIALTALYWTAAYIRSLRAFRAALPADHAALAGLLKERPLRRKVSVRVYDRIAAPLTYGVLRPVILLPRSLARADADTLRLVLAHELTHIRRFDCLWKLVAAAAVCIHWFNPAVWLLFYLFSRDLELACDRTVVRRGGPDSRAAYAMTLLRLAESQSTSSPLFSHFSKHPLEERIQCIMISRKYSMAGLTLASALILGTTSAFAAPAPESPITPAAEAFTSAHVASSDAKSATVDANATYTIMHDGEGKDDLQLTASLDGAKKEVLEDGTILLTLEDGSTVTITSTDNVKIADESAPE